MGFGGSLIARLANVAATAIVALLAVTQPPPRAEASAIRPSPGTAHADKPAPFYQGCLIGVRGTRSNACVYGDQRGKRVLFLLGDSHAMQAFPALLVDARRRHWRLVVLTKRDCTPALTTIRNPKTGSEYRTCDTWRRHVLRRIESAGHTGIVAMSGDSGYTAYGRGGQVLYGTENAAALEAGYLATLRRVRAAGLGAIVIRNTPEAPFDVPDCVAANRADPAACDFPLPNGTALAFDVRAAHRAGVPLVDLTPRICHHGICDAVIGGILVYRDNAHLTATFARTLGGAFEAALGRAARAGRAG
ncbi:MAG: hypothetical protein JSU06_04525 [Actinobacteria bacterium]|nr:hypothetical protein [Actinomycetota bacterium]